MAKTILQRATNQVPLRRRARPLEGASAEALLAWLREEIRSNRPAFAWLEGGRTVVAAGVAARSSAPRLGALRPPSSSDSEQAPPPPGLPLAFVGASFDERRGAPWEGWPPAEAVAPALLLCAPEDGAGWAVAQGPGGDPGRLAAALAALSLPTPGPNAAPRGLAAAPLEARADFEARVAEALEAIAADDCEKVVLARARRYSAAAAFDPVTVLSRLRAAQPDAICFLWAWPGRGAFVGATPETLARVDADGVLRTHALAGTARPGEEASLLRSAKDLREHRLTLEAIVESLAPLCRELRVAPPRARRLPGLVHLETPLRARLRPDVGLLEVGERLHPTPAVGGRPRERALSLLASEPLARGRYAAPLGWIGAGGEGALAVALRCALVRGREAYAFAGAGVVAGSRPEAEWDETELKLETVAAALAESEASRP